MELLRHILPPALALAILTGCDKVTITETLKLETDTYIASHDRLNHSDLDHLAVTKSAALEERIILKFPTGERNEKKAIEESLKNPLVIFNPIFIIYVAILEAILDCRNTVLQPQNLTDAKLVLDIVDSQESALSGKLGLYLLARPWWQNVTWDRAHYFSGRGRWSSPGGDTDAGFSRIDNTLSGTSIHFDITTYFKSLITTQNSVHYGLLITANPATLGSVHLHSVQSASPTLRPRILATYTGSCVRSRSLPGETRTFYLGEDPLTAP